ncbi:hypothetical protein [Spirosoma utsteinense]|uniref:Uncharacterized protein n=1 Tax=Spirosoma utsteinense TaxID=2585773 RepID=A0ABR6WDQ7_9BACT|nr:hypothetical protein [Spirosoma utsteinense]MBC3784447.1 hypothetical protein [Spirosoma utsteinense]MBC3794692.1 hypothetical protein [Spirosoma utsteinense]
MNSRSSIPMTPWYDDAFFQLASIWWRHRLSILLVAGILVVLPFMMWEQVNTFHYVAAVGFGLLCIREMIRFIRLSIHRS